MFLPFDLFVRDQRDQRSQSNLIALTWKVWKIFGAVYLHGWHLQVTSYMKAKQAICPGHRTLKTKSLQTSANASSQLKVSCSS
jgi:hypothetical protein